MFLFLNQTKDERLLIWHVGEDHKKGNSKNMLEPLTNTSTEDDDA